MLHDEFVMKRMSGLKRQIRRGRRKRSLDGRTPPEEYAACREELARQAVELSRVLREPLAPALDEAGLAIRQHDDLAKAERRRLREYFRENVLPVLTPLAVDAEHPFPFISGRGLNLAIFLPDEEGERFATITAYDYPTARIADRAGADVILVGDSVANVVLGHQDTLSVDVDTMVHHIAAVVRAEPRALIVGDMPWMSYHVSQEDTVRNAGRNSNDIFQCAAQLNTRHILGHIDPEKSRMECLL